eukprot:scaffold81529_cov61-Phaeocystis_antarctica.AAC.1
MRAPWYRATLRPEGARVCGAAETANAANHDGQTSGSRTQYIPEGHDGTCELHAADARPSGASRRRDVSRAVNFRHIVQMSATHTFTFAFTFMREENAWLQPCNSWVDGYLPPKVAQQQQLVRSTWVFSRER